MLLSLLFIVLPSTSREVREVSTFSDPTTVADARPLVFDVGRTPHPY